jgi:hypothetical protein
MKHPLKLLYGFVLAIIIFACHKEISFDLNERAKEIESAKDWYQTNRTGTPTLKSGTETQISVTLIPNWEEAYRRKNKRYRTVEVALNSIGRLTFTTSEVYDFYKQSKDYKYRQSMTRLVIRTDRKTEETIAFLMTIIPSQSYFEKTNFKPFHNTYIKRDKDYDGYIVFHNLNGILENGWKYENGQITKALHKNTQNTDFILKSGYYDCTTYVYYTTYTECQVLYTMDEWGEVTNEEEYGCEEIIEIEDTWQECYWVEDPDPYDPYEDDYGSSGGYSPTNPTEDESPTNEAVYHEEELLPTYSQIATVFSNVKNLSAAEVYELIGGNVYQNYIDDPISFANACALRLSYAFNMLPGFEIPFESNETISGDVNHDGVKEWYYFRVIDLVDYIDEYYGFNHTSTTDNIQGMKGIIWQSDCGWGDASGHLDLWDGNNAENHFYDECTEIYFWKMKE